MTDNTRYAAKTRFLKQTKPRLRETFYKDEQAGSIGAGRSGAG